jgi:hypothetical protein
MVTSVLWSFMTIAHPTKVYSRVHSHKRHECIIKSDVGDSIKTDFGPCSFVIDLDFCTVYNLHARVLAIVIVRSFKRRSCSEGRKHR